MKRFLSSILFCLILTVVSAQPPPDSLRHRNPDHTEIGHDTLGLSPREKMLEMNNRRQAVQLRKYKDSWEERLSITLLIVIVTACVAIAGFSK